MKYNRLVYFVYIVKVKRYFSWHLETVCVCATTQCCVLCASSNEGIEDMEGEVLFRHLNLRRHAIREYLRRNMPKIDAIYWFLGRQISVPIRKLIGILRERRKIPALLSKFVGTWGQFVGAQGQFFGDKSDDTVRTVQYSQYSAL
jgi:hypothetical protein